MTTRQDMDALFSADLVTTLAQGFRQLEPLYRYLMGIESMKRLTPEQEEGSWSSFQASARFER